MSKWTAADVPEQRGRVAVVTGANTGIGYETARALAARGAAVLLACRDADRAKAAAERIADSAPGAEVGTVRLDLGSLASVRAAADEIRGRYERIDLLINNAGVTGLRGRTADGVEIQFGVNHLGHFALTGLLLDLLAPGARVVAVSSIGHRFGRFDDAGNPCGTSAYADSKLANLLFTHELDRRLRAADRPVSALAAHPGGASTEVFRYSPPWFRIPNLAVAKLFGRTPAMGALPTLRAATDPAARGSEYYGPDGLFEIQGHPTVVKSSARSQDSRLRALLWSASEAATGVRYLG
ncbi:oxidoreductase [Nocardia mexicana]|uniref:NAD(P)-dependent dehydrogenase (Short-subunit alcohol dehydrogenase family) n=1 Tax=Nocardia mexicana TaxID=279262 RepID=A0A370H200_9NOCA|nr:oxidoreductase [Nocardia mexicana]RDI50040.1 NAD(P)-dependent dehydrogenase (short-subunit alcohol dehydrogenase family) [Nocardia mexicana]